MITIKAKPCLYRTKIRFLRQNFMLKLCVKSINTSHDSKVDKIRT